jgi:hypothetical protein
MLRCKKPQDSLLMSLSSKKRPTQSSCLKIPQRLPMLLPLKTMLRLLDVALSQNPYTTLQYLVLPISPTTFYISKTTTYPPCPLLQTLQKPFMSCAQILGDLLSMSGSQNHAPTKTMCKKSQSSPCMFSFPKIVQKHLMLCA